MRGKPWPSRRTFWTLLLTATSAASLTLAVVSYERLRDLQRESLRFEKEMPLILNVARTLAQLRAEMGESDEEPTGLSEPDLIPFLESSAAQVGLTKESLSINTENPTPVAREPGLLEQTTRVEVKGASLELLVKFLAAVEERFPSLETREIVLDPPLKGGTGWNAHVVLSAQFRQGTPSTP